MNSPEDSNTLRACRRVRRWDALFARSSGESRIARRHREHCVDCEIYFAGDAVFEEALRRSARDMVVEAPVGLERRILRAHADAVPSRSFSRGFSLAGASWALAGVALVAVVAFITAIQPEVQRRAPGAEVIAEQERPANWRALAAPARDWFARNPLEEELVSLTTNAQSVLGFLALNFLPVREDDAHSPEDYDPTDAGRG